MSKCFGWFKRKIGVDKNGAVQNGSTWVVKLPLHGDDADAAKKRKALGLAGLEVAGGSTASLPPPGETVNPGQSLAAGSNASTAVRRRLSLVGEAGNEDESSPVVNSTNGNPGGGGGGVIVEGLCHPTKQLQRLNSGDANKKGGGGVGPSQGEPDKEGGASASWKSKKNETPMLMVGLRPNTDTIGKSVPSHLALQDSAGVREAPSNRPDVPDKGPNRPAEGEGKPLAMPASASSMRQALSQKTAGGGAGGAGHGGGGGGSSIHVGDKENKEGGASAVGGGPTGGGRVSPAIPQLKLQSTPRSILDTAELQSDVMSSSTPRGKQLQPRTLGVGPLKYSFEPPSSTGPNRPPHNGTPPAHLLDMPFKGYELLPPPMPPPAGILPPLAKKKTGDVVGGRGQGDRGMLQPLQSAPERERDEVMGKERERKKGEKERKDEARKVRQGETNAREDKERERAKEKERATEKEREKERETETETERARQGERDEQQRSSRDPLSVLQDVSPQVPKPRQPGHDNAPQADRASQPSATPVRSSSKPVAPSRKGRPPQPPEEAAKGADSVRGWKEPAIIATQATDHLSADEAGHACTPGRSAMHFLDVNEGASGAHALSGMRGSFAPHSSSSSYRMMTPRTETRKRMSGGGAMRARRNQTPSPRPEAASPVDMTRVYSTSSMHPAASPSPLQVAHERSASPGPALTPGPAIHSHVNDSETPAVSSSMSDWMMPSSGPRQSAHAPSPVNLDAKRAPWVATSAGGMSGVSEEKRAIKTIADTSQGVTAMRGQAGWRRQLELAAVKSRQTSSNDTSPAPYTSDFGSTMSAWMEPIAAQQAAADNMADWMSPPTIDSARGTPRKRVPSPGASLGPINLEFPTADFFAAPGGQSARQRVCEVGPQ